MGIQQHTLVRLEQTVGKVIQLGCHALFILYSTIYEQLSTMPAHLAISKIGKMVPCSEANLTSGSEAESGPRLCRVAVSIPRNLGARVSIAGNSRCVLRVSIPLNSPLLHHFCGQYTVIPFNNSTGRFRLDDGQIHICQVWAGERSNITGKRHKTRP